MHDQGETLVLRVVDEVRDGSSWLQRSCCVRLTVLAPVSNHKYMYLRQRKEVRCITSSKTAVFCTLPGGLTTSVKGCLEEVSFFLTRSRLTISSCPLFVRLTCLAFLDKISLLAFTIDQFKNRSTPCPEAPARYAHIFRSHLRMAC